MLTRLDELISWCTISDGDGCSMSFKLKKSRSLSIVKSKVAATVFSVTGQVIEPGELTHTKTSRGESVETFADGFNF